MTRQLFYFHALITLKLQTIELWCLDTIYVFMRRVRKVSEFRLDIGTRVYCLRGARSKDLALFYIN
jgi:hypothetical protein